MFLIFCSCDFLPFLHRFFHISHNSTFKLHSYVSISAWPLICKSFGHFFISFNISFFFFSLLTFSFREIQLKWAMCAMVWPNHGQYTRRLSKQFTHCQIIWNHVAWMSSNLVGSVYSSSSSFCFLRVRRLQRCGCHSHYVDISLVITSSFFSLFSSLSRSLFGWTTISLTNFLVFTFKYFLCTVQRRRSRLSTPPHIHMFLFEKKKKTHIYKYICLNAPKNKKLTKESNFMFA